MKYDVPETSIRLDLGHLKIQITKDRYELKENEMVEPQFSYQSSFKSIRPSLHFNNGNN